MVCIRSSIAVGLVSASLIVLGCGPQYEATGGGALPEDIVPVAVYHAELNGASMTPNPVTSEGAGYARARQFSDRLELNGAYRGLSGPVPASGEVRNPGSTSRPGVYMVADTGTDVGRIVLAQLAVEPDENAEGLANSGMMFGTLALTPAQTQMLRDGRFQLLIRTDSHPDGELAGWLEQFDADEFLRRPVITVWQDRGSRAVDARTDRAAATP
ncbi:MAG: CHRD domain-containing protein [Phycisphaeraceae bacterium]